MKKTLFLLAIMGVASAAEYVAHDATSFLAAWEQAKPGDSISVTADIDFSELSAPLADKSDSVVVESKSGKIIHWSAGSGAPLPAGFAPQGIMLVNVPGTVLKAASGTPVIVGEGSRFEISQGGGSAIIAGENGVVSVAANAAFSGLVSSEDGGVLRVEDGGAAVIQGGAEFSDNASAGFGGAICVADQSGRAYEDEYHLTLISTEGKDITFSGNQSEATPVDGGESSTYWEGFSNDIYLGEGARMMLNAGVGSAIRLEGGVESADDTAGVVKAGKGDALLGEGSFYSGSLYVEDGKAIIAEDATWGDGSDSVQVSSRGTVELSKGSTLSGEVSLQGSLAATGDATVAQALTIASGDATVSVAAGAKLDAFGGLTAADAEAELTKTGEGSLRLKGDSDFAGTLTVQQGSVALLENATLGENSKAVVIGQVAEFALQAGSTLSAPLEMYGGSLVVQAPASLTSTSVSLGSGKNTWTFDMQGVSRQNGVPALTLNPGLLLTTANGASLTLNFTNIDNIRKVSDSIFVVNIADLSDAGSKDILVHAKITYTDASGKSYDTAAVLDPDTGMISIEDLLAYVDFDRPGRAAVNAIWSSAGALRSFGATLRGQLPLHHAPQAGGKGMQAWAAALGYYETASGAWRYSGGGFAVGATYTTGSRGAEPAALFGLALGCMSGSNKARLADSGDAEAKTEQDSLMLALYTRQALGRAAALDFTLAYGRTGNDFSSTSHTGSWDDDTFLASARCAWELRDRDGVRYTPFIGLEYTAAQQAAATFRGNNSHWSSGGADLGVLSLPVGISFHNSLEAGGSKIFTPQLDILYRADILRSNPSATISDGYSTWSAKGNSPARSAFEVRGTLHLQVKENWALWATSGLEVRSDNTSLRFSAGASYAF